MWYCPPCSCSGPASRRPGPRERNGSHGVALRFQQYAHWAPYVCYDAIYERMKLNYTSEVQRLSRAVLGNENAVDASAVVQHVDELANRKPTSCQRGANSPKRGRHQPRKCWDSTTGFGAGHVHAATSKPKAYSKRIVLDEVQRRVPHCDVYLAGVASRRDSGAGSRLMGMMMATIDSRRTRTPPCC